MTPEIIKEKIMQNIPDADVVVEDLAGDQKHFGVDVISSKFKGKSIIEQHQMIYKVLGEISGATIIFGEPDTEPILGVTVLESLGLSIDPQSQTLKKLPVITFGIR